jgi:2-polyprenyl-3-methyl-5-hydroxy-6-metoxy-1,4-benzoquinol methylase
VICDCCSYSEFNVEYKIKDLKHKTTNKEFLLKKCKKCGVYIITENNDIVNTSKYYPKEYSAFQKLETQINENGKSFFNNVVKGRLAWTNLVKMNRGDKVLDIGCGNGRDMQFIKKKYHVDIQGVEPSEQAVIEGTTNGLKITKGAFEDYNMESKFEIIYLIHVIEHLSKPTETLNKIYKMLETSGKIVICTPNTKSLERIIFNRYWDGWDTPRHTYVFNASNLEYLLNKVGFTNIKIYYEIYSLFYRSLNNIFKANNQTMNRFLRILSTRINKLFSYILPHVKLSGAIQVIAEKQASENDS